LRPLEFEGWAAAVDQILLARLAVNPGPHWMAAWVAAALDSVCLAVTNGPPAETLIAGLLSCLPLECRTEFSFTTGLRFSPRRPFRIVGFSGTSSELGMLAQHYNLDVFDFAGPKPERFAPSQGWAVLIDAVLATGRTPLLATALSKRRFELTSDALPVLALQLSDEMEKAGLRHEEGCGEEEHAGGPRDLSGSRQRAHAAHHLTVPATAAGAAASSASTNNAPSKMLHPDAPEVVEKLEQLDDAVFEAIGGENTALETLRTLWPQVRAQLGEMLLEESREQYLRYALSIWEECVDADGVRDAGRAMRAMDVLCLLFE
jgi:hypothetical protein